MVIPPFRHRSVRDLAWACFAPPLVCAGAIADGVSDARFALTPARLRWLEALDHTPRPLLEAVAGGQGSRLGLYFERLWHFFLAQDPAVELLARNLPLRDGNRTLGEFDCLYFCRDRGRAVHLELAVKYYLGAGGLWYGPDPRDRLDRKLERMLQHQLRLADHPVAAAVLREVGADEPLREMALKGRMFRALEAPQPLPAGFNPVLSPGDWLAPQRLQRYLAWRDCTGCCVVQRLDWLVPLQDGDPGYAPCPAAQLQRHLAQRFGRGGPPQLVAGFDHDGRERVRCFVAGERWLAALSPQQT